MSLQNRVTPWGNLVATEARGTVMGNRGCLHDTGDYPLRQYQTERWIVCKLQFNDRRREPMPPNKYTSLFFLDEATALAAGHRPCFECNRAKFYDFVHHWRTAHPKQAEARLQDADAIDAQLHRERITNERYQREKRKQTFEATIDTLPDYCFIAFGEELQPYILYRQCMLPWTAEGYGTPASRPSGVSVLVLTPHSTVNTLVQGYQPDVHPSVRLPATAP